MASSKGKEKLMERNSGKRKKACSDDDESGGRKQRNRGVLQFFEDSAVEVHEDEDFSSNDEDDFHINDFLQDEVFNDVKANNEPVKVPLVPFIKADEMDDAELERMVEERYGRGSSFIRYAEDGHDNREAVDRDENLPDLEDPTLWKVKCMVGREKHSVYCLMQKYVHLQTLGIKLQIISAFSLDHVNGFIYIEAHNQQDLYEACKGLHTVYVSRVTTVPSNQHPHVLSVRSIGCGITADMWARVKRGKYKGDLARIVAVNEARKKATVKLIPRIDLRVVAEKFGGGVPVKKTNTAILPRLISSCELEAYRPLIQNRRDRDTNMNFEVLNGMMLKDGYLFKKIPIDSLTVWGAMPTEDEILNFEQLNNNESMDLEFLTDLYGNGNRKTKQCMNNDDAGEKGEGASTTNMGYDFEVHDLVFFGKKDFGVIIGMEKDNNFKIMKEGTAEPLVLTLPSKNLKRALFDKKLFTAQDRQMKKISIGDRVRVIDGLLKDKEGVVKHIYGGIIFLFNGREDEHNGYICFESSICEKVISACEGSHEQGNEPGSSGFGESPSSPKTPLSTDKAWQRRENKCFNQEDKDAMLSVGQSLRIRVGPLKGYLCCALAIRRSNVIVKLNSQHKILTVKQEHLSEVQGRSSASVTGGDQESAEPFDLLGTTDGFRGKKNSDSTYRKQAEGSSWGHQPDVKLEESRDQADKKQSWGNQGGSSLKKQYGGSSWNKDGGSSWSKPVESSYGQADSKAEVSHEKINRNKSCGGQGSSSWNKTVGKSTWSKPAGRSSWGAKAEEPNKINSSSWNQNGAWNSIDLDKENQNDSWGVEKTSEGGSSTGWGKDNWGKSSIDDCRVNPNSAWSSKSDWGAGNDYSGSHIQVDNISRGGGRGRIWRGGRGGTSTRIEKGNWGKSSTDDPPENQNSAGDSKSDWNARNYYNGRHQQVANISCGGGRGGSWRGGQGGRGESDRDSFGGRGGPAHSGFRGRGGCFGGRQGSGRGGYRGRGRSDRGGFGGRGCSDQGGFRGRSCGRSDHYGGDRYNRNNSGEKKSTSWSKASWSADGGSFNENEGNWNQSDAYGEQQKGWCSEIQSKGNIDVADGGGQRKSWNSGGSWSKGG